MEKSETDCDNDLPENKECIEASDDVDASNDNQNLKCKDGNQKCELGNEIA